MTYALNHVLFVGAFWSSVPILSRLDCVVWHYNHCLENSRNSNAPLPPWHLPGKTPTLDYTHPAPNSWNPVWTDFCFFSWEAANLAFYMQSLYFEIKMKCWQNTELGIECLKAETRDFQSIISALMAFHYAPSNVKILSAHVQVLHNGGRDYFSKLFLPTPYFIPYASRTLSTLTFSLLFTHAKFMPASESLHSLFLLPRMLWSPSLLLSPPLCHNQVSSLSFRDLSLSIIPTKRSFLTTPSQVGPHRTW